MSQHAYIKSSNYTNQTKQTAYSFRLLSTAIGWAPTADVTVPLRATHGKSKDQRGTGLTGLVYELQMLRARVLQVDEHSTGSASSTHDARLLADSATFSAGNKTILSSRHSSVHKLRSTFLLETYS